MHGRLANVPAGVPRFDHIPGTNVPLGLLYEPAATNHLAWGRRLARGLAKKAWAADGVLVIDDAAGLDHKEGVASSLTAQKGGATLMARVPLPRDEYTFSAWVRRRTGYGRVDITLDGGTTWQEITACLLGGRWDRVGTDKPLADPVVGFRFAEAGDAIEVDFCQLETGRFATSEIRTGAAPASRAAETLVLDGWAFRWPVDAMLGVARHIRSVTLADGEALVQWTGMPGRHVRTSRVAVE